MILRMIGTLFVVHSILGHRKKSAESVVLEIRISFFKPTVPNGFVRLRHPDYCQSERIRFDREAASFWAGHGIPVVLPCRTRNGEKLCGGTSRISGKPIRIYPAGRFGTEMNPILPPWLAVLRSCIQ